MRKRARKLRGSFEEEAQYEKERTKTCELCGKPIKDYNNTGSLCYRCFMREYSPHMGETDYEF